jgi:hypothetical protein
MGCSSCRNKEGGIRFGLIDPLPGQQLSKGATLRAAVRRWTWISAKVQTAQAVEMPVQKLFEMLPQKPLEKPLMR